MKRKKAALAALAAVAVIGLAMAAYPQISAGIQRKAQSEIRAGYEQRIEEQGEDGRQDQLAAAREYNGELAAGKILGSRYYELLNFGEHGLMGYVEIPKIEVALPVYHGTEDTVLRLGAGHMPGSSLPVGGTGTHAVISAHSGMASDPMFSNLDQMAVGDTFTVTVLGEEMVYQVDQSVTVLPTDTEYLRIDPERDYVTLLTCTPYGINSHRLLVRGRRVEAAPGEDLTLEPEPTGELPVIGNQYRGILLGAGAAVLLLVPGGAALALGKGRKK